jgi:hypothetical protein
MSKERTVRFRLSISLILAIMIAPITSSADSKTVEKALKEIGCKDSVELDAVPTGFIQPLLSVMVMIEDPQGSSVMESLANTKMGAIGKDTIEWQGTNHPIIGVWLSPGCSAFSERAVLLIFGETFAYFISDAPANIKKMGARLFIQVVFFEKEYRSTTVKMFIK